MSSATNFFERQDDARRNTSWLVALFAVAVVLVILALSVPLFLNGRVQEGLVVGGVVGAVVLLASGFRLLQLRGGGRVVASPRWPGGWRKSRTLSLKPSRRC